MLGEEKGLKSNEDKVTSNIYLSESSNPQYVYDIGVCDEPLDNLFLILTEQALQFIRVQ